MQKFNGIVGFLPALQSRIAKRGRYIASAEKAYTEVKSLARAYGASELHKRAREVRAEIKIMADDQRLDRTLLKTLQFWYF